MTDISNTETLFFDGDSYFEDLCHEIQKAQYSIAIEVYILADDDVGQKLLQELIVACERGVVVRLMVDAMGSRHLKYSKIQKLKAQGLIIKRYHVYSWLNPFSKKLNKRDHRKLVIIDQKTAYIGGMNFHEDESYKHNPPIPWVDVQVKITGELLPKLNYLFLRQFFRFYPKNRSLEKPKFPNDVIVSGFYFRRSRFKRFLIYQIKSAKQNIRILTAYFVPDLETIYHLIQASQRGVTIEVITSSHKTSDVPFVNRIHQPIIKFLIQNDIQVYYHHKKMIHSKVCGFDNKVVTVGSSNLNHRSFFIDLEIDYISRNPETVEKLKSHFQDLKQDCNQVTVEQIQNRTLWNKWIDGLLFLIRRYF